MVGADARVLKDRGVAIWPLAEAQTHLAAGEPWEAIRCLRKALWQVDELGTSAAHFRRSAEERKLILAQIEKLELLYPNWRDLERQRRLDPKKIRR